MVPARELRFCFVIDDYEAAAHLYRDVFGLEVLLDLDEQGGRGVILNVPEATLELVDAEHGGMVDDVEVGGRVDDRVRIAVRVDDLQAASRAVTGTDLPVQAVDPLLDRAARLRPGLVVLDQL